MSSVIRPDVLPDLLSGSIEEDDADATAADDEDDDDDDDAAGCPAGHGGLGGERFSTVWM